MPDCDYCGESFDGERTYLKHLEAEHADELGRIDRRRVEAIEDDGGGFPFGVATGPVALVAVILLSAGVVAYVVLFAGSGAGGAGGADGGPSDLGSVHYHGTINLTVLGDRVDFTRPEYKHPRENPAFHFEAENDPRWHVHARGVTLQYAMGTLDINVTDSSVTFNGTTYRDDSSEYRVVVTVDGEDVDPARYVLKDGDHVRIVVTRE